MALLFKNAKILLGGVDVSGTANQVALDFSAESLDTTTFGNSTKIMDGGLKVAKATGRGFWTGGLTLDQTVFDLIGLDDAVLTLLPDTIIEGSTSTGGGFAFKVTSSHYGLGGPVGQLLPFDFAVEGRGIQA